MTKVKLLGIAVVALVLLNIVTLVKVFNGRSGHPGPPPREGPKALIIERLHFDPEQTEAYEALIEEHQVAIGSQDEMMMAARSALYHDMTRTNWSTRDSLLGVIAAVQWKVEETHVDHFLGIRDLCRADQLSDFDALSHDLAGYFSRGRGGPPRQSK